MTTHFLSGVLILSLSFFFWFNLKPHHHTTQREKEMQKSLCAGTKRPLTMVLVNAFWSFTSSKLGLGRLEGGRAEEPWPGITRAGLGVAVHSGLRHIALWIISFSNKWTICSRKALPLTRGTHRRTSAHVRSEESLLYQGVRKCSVQTFRGKKNNQPH